ncbi:DUF456 domain-containing protein [Gordonia polyisoprenivorans]|uniref:DUF456 domain-containing protein n=1 Tax=Gordonia TaxID=2053 RepID=UPI000362FC35|nr:MULTISPECIES: DUF456 domain-containing protein [Gordonia]MDF3284467.1 DUF456 domain-containing protein [Gordonia sp. N1V]OPX13690.1 hypothetical protein B1964_19015 [Gordonia sp. i37]QUD83370.1 DUF456 domain-containing protein [Gordonia polyisoprenivorans]
MPLYGEVIVGVCIAVGLLGIVVPVLPGTLLVAVSILVWAIVVGGWAWAVFALAAVLIGVGEIVKYVVAGRVLRRHEIPNRTIVVGGVVGIVGFFVVPVVGLFLGFIAGALVSELVRTRTAGAAWRGTVAATKAAAVTIGIELFGALLASGTWLAGAIAL